MPYVNVRTVKGMLSGEQKQALMQRFADALVEIEGGGNPDFRKVVSIEITESEPAQWLVGELRLTPEWIAGFVQQRDAAAQR